MGSSVVPLALLSLSSCADSAGAESLRVRGAEAGLGEGGTQRDGGTGEEGDAPTAAVDAAPPTCLDLDAGSTKGSLTELACESDFLALAAEPADFSLPAARSVKTVIDRDHGDQLYFQNTRRYAIHWEFASQWLGAEQGLSSVPSLAEFNQSEYYVPSRRFVLGALTHYERSDTWVYELAPYDTADASTIAAAFEQVRSHFFAADALRFHPTSEAIAARVQELDLPLVESETLLQTSDYVPFTLGQTYGVLQLSSQNDSPSPYRIVVSNAPSAEQGPVAGLISEEVPAPLGNAALSAFMRRVPTVRLKDAAARLAAFDGKWVHFTATASDFQIEEASQEQGMMWWQARQSESVDLEAAAQSPIVEPAALLDGESPSPQVLADLVARYGATTAQMAVLAQSFESAQPSGVALPKTLALPASYYSQFMASSGLVERMSAWADDASFDSDWVARAAELGEFREQLIDAPFDSELQEELSSLMAPWDAGEIWLVPSTNAVGAGADQEPALGTHRYEPGSDQTLADAIQAVWAAQWSLAAVDSRAELGIDPAEFAVGVLFEAGPGTADAETSGFALTNNPFDPSGLEPCYYANVQSGAGPSLTVGGDQVDQWLLYFGNPNQPISPLRTAGDEPRMGRADVLRLGAALSFTEDLFAPLYRPELGLDPWWAMQLWFGIAPGLGANAEATLVVRGARPVLRR